MYNVLPIGTRIAESAPEAVERSDKRRYREGGHIVSVRRYIEKRLWPIINASRQCSQVELVGRVDSRRAGGMVGGLQGQSKM